MKIGIVTFFNAPNYGAMLQAYALQEYLRGRGHQTVFIDGIRWNPIQWSFKGILLSRSMRSLRTKIELNRVRAPLLPFQQRLKKTKAYTSISSISRTPPVCDCFIVGSDQMWNVDFVKRHAWPFVFLDAFGDKALRIAYAVSFGRSIPEEFRDEIGQLMRKFTAISVREQNAVEWVHELSGKEADYLCDPTLLWEKEYYDALLPVVPIDLKSPYIFEYIIRATPNDILQDVKKHFKVAHVKADMCPSDQWFSRITGLQVKVSVEEWVQRIKCATFVVTDSFHGTLFSIIYQKPFLVLPLAGHLQSQNDRICSILGFLGLENRVFDATTPTSLSALLDSPIPWEDVHQRLAEWRKKTDVFFQRAGL